jgi:tRNA A58 N-methylase Trm61
MFDMIVIDIGKPWRCLENGVHQTEESISSRLDRGYVSIVSYSVIARESIL